MFYRLGFLVAMFAHSQCPSELLLGLSINIWGESFKITLTKRIKGVDVLDKLILYRIPMYSVNQYPSIWYVMTPFHDGKNHITYVPELRYTTLIKQMLNKFSFGESKEVVIY